jgi:hypothetical protein
MLFIEECVLESHCRSDSLFHLAIPQVLLMDIGPGFGHNSNLVSHMTLEKILDLLSLISQFIRFLRGFSKKTYARAYSKCLIDVYFCFHFAKMKWCLYSTLTTDLLSAWTDYLTSRHLFHL